MLFFVNKFTNLDKKFIEILNYRDQKFACGSYVTTEVALKKIIQFFF